jgi:hypothetical protein
MYLTSMCTLYSYLWIISRQVWQGMARQTLSIFVKELQHISGESHKKDITHIIRELKQGFIGYARVHEDLLAMIADFGFAE